MLMLPLQATWAAAAAYCAHESSPASAKHIGHHEHVHKASAGDSSKTGGFVKVGDMDPDCDYCHLSVTQWLPALPDVVPPLMEAAHALADQPPIESHIGLGPERPDRSLAV